MAMEMHQLILGFSPNLLSNTYFIFWAEVRLFLVITIHGINVVFGNIRFEINNRGFCHAPSNLKAADCDIFFVGQQ